MSKRYTVVSKRGPTERPSSVVEHLRTEELEMRLVLKIGGVTVADAVDYVKAAIDGWSGSFDGDDPRRDVEVLSVRVPGWVDFRPDLTPEEEA